MSEPLREISGRDLPSPELFACEIIEACRPVVIRSLVRGWPVVQGGRDPPEAFRTYLSQFDVSGQTEAFFGAPQIAGKYYYNDDLKGFNFERRRMRFTEVLDTIVSTAGVAG